MDDEGHEDQRAMLDLPMRGLARPNVINAAGIVPWAFHETDVNCAVYQLSKHLELPQETVQEEMEVLFAKHHPGESFFVSPKMVLEWCEGRRSCYFYVANQLPTRQLVAICGSLRTPTGAPMLLHGASGVQHRLSCQATGWQTSLPTPGRS